MCEIRKSRKRGTEMKGDVVMKKAIVFTAFVLGGSVLLAQTPAKPAAAQAPKPAAAAAPKAAAAPAVKAAEAPKPAPPAPNPELEKFKAQQEAIQKATEVAREWFRRLNALDGSEESVNRFLEIHTADAVYTSGPRGEDQIGAVYFQGSDDVRKFAAKMAKSYSRIAYFIKQRTTDNLTADLVTGSMNPWGEVNIAVEFAGSINIKESVPAKESAPIARGNQDGAKEGSNVKETFKERRFTVPGSAFFAIKDGKISRIRIMYAGGESFEVGGTWILNL